MATFFIWYHWRDDDAGTSGRDHWDTIEANTPLEALSRWMGVEAEKWKSMNPGGWHAEAPVNRDDLPKLFDTEAQEVAFLFAKNIELWLTAEEIKDINEQNAKYDAEGDTNSDASHDYCDPNQAMINALCERGFTIDIQSDEQRRLMNDAWAIARKCGYSAKNVAEDARNGQRDAIVAVVESSMGYGDWNVYEECPNPNGPFMTSDGVTCFRNHIGYVAADSEEQALRNANVRFNDPDENTGMGVQRTLAVERVAIEEVDEDDPFNLRKHGLC